MTSDRFISYYFFQSEVSPLYPFVGFGGPARAGRMLSSLEGHAPSSNFLIVARGWRAQGGSRSSVQVKELSSISQAVLEVHKHP